jgi:beta-lactamase class A
MRPALLALIFCALTHAQPTVIELLEGKTLAELRRFDGSLEGTLGVAVIDLETGRVFALNGDTVFPQASVIKVPILAAMHRAGLRFDDRVTLQPGEAVEGGGLYALLKRAPVTLPVGELAAAMIVDSDNTATNRCIDLVGMDSVNKMLDDAGFPRTRLQRKMMDGEAARRNAENIGTPNEMARLVESIYRRKLVNDAAATHILGLMKKVRGGIAQGLPLDTEASVKTGELPGARCETGIVFLPGRPFILSVMSAFIDDRRTPVPEVTRIVYRMFEKLARSNRYGRTVR